jgi:cytoskeletal protein CcmA (bactofilin family)
VAGNLHVRRLAVELGATFNGNCKTITEAEFSKLAGLEATAQAKTAQPQQARAN